MEPAEYVDAIRLESAALVAAAESAGLSTAVPSCPGWTVTDLLVHMGTVQRWAGGIVERRAQERDYPEDVGRPDDPAALAAWVLDGAGRLAAIFSAAPPDVGVWTFAGRGTARFWFRRQAHEVSLHRVDAQLAAGTSSPIGTDLARDGIDEFFDVVVAARLRDRMRGSNETVHLHCTDGEGEWLVRLTPDGPEVGRIHAKGDVAARGTASDLLLVLRGRLDPATVDVFGDATLLEHFVDLSRV